MRQFYQEFQLSPATRPLIKYTALKLGADKATACTSTNCSTALPPNSPPSWPACPDRRIAYDRLCSADPRNPCRAPVCAVRAYPGQRQARCAQPDPRRSPRSHGHAA
ncbi:hypothetical protein [Pseudomonas veronii]|uniref:hypothetical protein n=1 Tax=Pseudomonas veronii TaxID=76761 RepID=UPI003B9FCEBF